MEERLKKYISSYRAGYRILTVIMAALCILFVVCAVIGNDVQYIGLVYFAAGLVLSLIPLWRDRQFFKKLERDRQLQAAAEDFDRAISMRKDRIRFGKNWIFMKGSIRLLRYEEIVRIYQYVHKTNFIENQRQIKYVGTDGKTRTMCNLRLRGKSDEEVKRLIGLIYSKNPNIQIGYR